MVKRKSTKGQKRSTKHTHKTKDRVTRTPRKTGGEHRCSGRVTSSYSTSGTRCVNIAVFMYVYTSVKHTSHMVSLNSNTTDISSGAGHVYLSDAPKFTLNVL